MLLWQQHSNTSEDIAFIDVLIERRRRRRNGVNREEELTHRWRSRAQLLSVRPYVSDD